MNLTSKLAIAFASGVTAGALIAKTLMKPEEILPIVHKPVESEDLLKEQLVRNY